MNVTAPAVATAILAMLLASSPTQLDAARQALEREEERLAASMEKAGVAAAFSPFVSETALFLEPDREILRGRDAVLAALADTAARVPLQRATLHRVGAGASSDGTLGYTFGWLERSPHRGPMERPKYLALWRAEAGGWRIAAFATSAGDAPPSAPPHGAAAAWGKRGRVAPEDPAKLAADVAATDEAFAALARRESVCAAFVGYADADAVVFRRADFGWGHAAVRSTYSGCKPRTRATWTPVWSAAAASGDLGASVGDAVFANDEDDGTGSSGTYAKYLTIWARQPDGTWKWLLDAGNMRPTPNGGPR